MEHLRNHLFEALERLMDPDDESIGVNEAQAVANIGKQINDGFKQEIAFLKMAQQAGYDPVVCSNMLAVPKRGQNALPPGKASSGSGPTREQSIGHIESLYPPDSHMKETAKIGQQLLEQIVPTNQQPADWRVLPDEHLHSMALACLVEAEEKELAREYKGII